MQADWAPGISISSVPLRKVVRRSSAITNGWERTTKNPIGYCAGESRGELYFTMLANIDPNVTAIMPQPCTEPFLDETGRLRRMTPDFAVIERGDSILFEVKSERQYRKAGMVERLAAFGAAIEARGWPFHVTLKEDILSDPRHPNVLDVWRRLRPSFTHLQKLAVENAVGTCERLIADVLRDLAASMGGEAPKLENIVSLAANGLIFIDMEAPIGEESVIRAADQAALPAPLLPRRRPADDIAARFAA